MFGSKPKVVKTSQEKNQIDINLYKCDDKGKVEGDAIGNGSSNYYSYAQFEGKVYWRIGDGIPGWIYDSEELNKDVENCSLNKLYVILIKEKKYKEANKA